MKILGIKSMVIVKYTNNQTETTFNKIYYKSEPKILELAKNSP